MKLYFNALLNLQTNNINLNDLDTLDNINKGNINYNFNYDELETHNYIYNTFLKDYNNIKKVEKDIEELKILLKKTQTNSLKNMLKEKLIFVCDNNNFIYQLNNCDIFLTCNIYDNLKYNNYNQILYIIFVNIVNLFNFNINNCIYYKNVILYKCCFILNTFLKQKKECIISIYIHNQHCYLEYYHIYNMINNYILSYNKKKKILINIFASEKIFDNLIINKIKDYILINNNFYL